MDQFYEGFNAVYKNRNNKISPDGRRIQDSGGYTSDSNGNEMGLDGFGILNNINKLKQYTLN